MQILKDRETPEIDDFEVLDSFKVSSSPDYWFIGGLRYGEDEVFVESDSVIEYPYTTYYTNRILPLTDGEKKFIPLSEINLPLIVLETDEKCLAADIEPVLESSGETTHHFVGFDQEKGEIQVVRPDFFYRKSKKAEWLGRGEKTKHRNPEVEEYELEFKEYSSWQEAVRSKLKGFEGETQEKDISQVFDEARNWLFRSWDDELGTFLQLPWRERPGFALEEYSYSLTANEAVRLDYFSEMGDKGLGEDFDYWSSRLKSIFKNSDMQKRDLDEGDGLVWYNTAAFNGESLEGDFYLGTGYYGYPGGQSMISYSLLRYLEREEDEELEGLVRENLEYILSTQKDSGHWPAALKQEMELPLKQDEYYGKVSEGATGESVKALVKAWKYFGDEKYQEAATEGLEALENNTPICRNGLRDIGTDEVEAFSAFSVIESFLEAYEEFGDQTYLEQAENYGLYLSTWVSTYSGDNLNLEGTCHPISETITQRISPYETVKAAKTFLKISEHVEEDFWRNLSDKCLKRALESINDTGGMSEGIFYDFEKGMENLETEQTFATAELLHTLEKIGEIERENRNASRTGKNVEMEIEGDRIVLDDTAFDLNSFGFSKIKDEVKNHELYFKGSYGAKSGLRSKAFSKLRRSKFLLAPKDLSYLWKGIRPKDIDPDIKKFSEVEKEVNTFKEDGKISFKITTEVYDLEGSVSAQKTDGKTTLDVEFEVSTSRHDLICEKVFLSTEEMPEGGVLDSEEFKFSLENSEDSEDGFDISRKGNWTHGGLYRGTMKLILD